MKKTWNERSKSEKILSISGIIVHIVIICALITKYLNLWPKALNLAIPLFAVYYLIETIYNWKINKDMAALSFIMMIFIAVVSCAVFFM